MAKPGLSPAARFSFDEKALEDARAAQVLEGAPWGAGGGPHALLRITSPSSMAGAAWAAVAAMAWVASAACGGLGNRGLAGRCSHGVFPLFGIGFSGALLPLKKGRTLLARGLLARRDSWAREVPVSPRVVDGHMAGLVC